jgi:hypothetical protein
MELVNSTINHMPETPVVGVKYATISAAPTVPHCNTSAAHEAIAILVNTTGAQ